jgi:hypothetical protein
MDIVNVYGYLADKSEVVVAVGNHNNVHGIACYQPLDQVLQIKPLPDVAAPSVVEFLIHHENPTGRADKNLLYFSLALKEPHDDKRWLHIHINKAGVAEAVLSSDKSIFTLSYSAVDKNDRSRILAGSLYSITTIFGEKPYTVSWKVQNFTNGELIMFLPTTWYGADTCEPSTGLHALLQTLQSDQFRGFVTQEWCHNVPTVTNCNEGVTCGTCMGQCPNPNHLCYPNPEDSNFVCRVPGHEPNLSPGALVTVASDTSSTTGITWFAVASVFVIIIILALGLAFQTRRR